VIAERVLGLPEKVQLRVHRRAARVSRRRARSLDKECTPAHVRDAWTNETGRVPGLWEQLAAMGVSGCSRRVGRRSRADHGRSRPHPRGDGPPRGPEPIVETAAFGRRSSAAPTSRSRPTRPSCRGPTPPT
jgi:hypothetical protein